MDYNKPPLSTDQHIELLQKRALIINDIERAKRYLRYIGYYRLSAYFIPYQHVKDEFNPGVTFDDVLALYIFDRKLRNHVMDAVERVEVAIRAVISNYMSQMFGSRWFLDPAHFQENKNHTDFIDVVNSALNQNKSNTFIKHYFEKYEKNSMPPCWMIMETLTLGSISKSFSGLRAKYKRAICKDLGLEYKVFEEFLRSLTVTRNKCAHHARFWNAKATHMPKEKTIEEVLNIPSRSTTFTQLSIIQFFICQITSNSSWASRLDHLIKNETPQKYINMCIDKMGFPDNWQTHKLWHIHTP
ncbi:MAG: Abi family protein [Desulfobacteraceae bacterium]|jgi:abortive infection bacteriophage resistance protein